MADSAQNSDFSHLHLESCTMTFFFFLAGGGYCMPCRDSHEFYFNKKFYCSHLICSWQSRPWTWSICNRHKSKLLPMLPETSALCFIIFNGLKFSNNSNSWWKPGLVPCEIIWSKFQKQFKCKSCFTVAVCLWPSESPWLDMWSSVNWNEWAASNKTDCGMWLVCEELSIPSDCDQLLLYFCCPPTANRDPAQK